MPDDEGERFLPRVNSQIDTDALAWIFMGRHVERLSPRIDRGTFDAIRTDLATWLGEIIPRVEDEAQRRP